VLIVLSKIPLINYRVTPPLLSAKLALASLPTPVTALNVKMFARKHLQGINPATSKYRILLSCVTKLTRSSVAIAAAKEKCKKNLRDLIVIVKQRAKR
jgi:hypothetical protein